MRRDGGSAIGTRRYGPIRLAVLVRDKWTCQYCGAWADEVDHVVRRRDGGTDDVKARDPDEIATVIDRLIGLTAFSDGRLAASGSRS